MPENFALGAVFAKLAMTVKAHPAIVAVDFLLGFGFGLLVARVLFRF